jgi:hypothetical protein
MTSSDLTAQLLCTVTGHVPIGLYYNRLLSHGNLHSACFCSFPTKTVMHQIHDCPDAVHSHPPKNKLCLAWFIKFLDVNMDIFAFDIEVFTLPLVFRSDSDQTAWTPRTVLGLSSDYSWLRGLLNIQCESEPVRTESNQVRPRS